MIEGHLTLDEPVSLDHPGAIALLDALDDLANDRLELIAAIFANNCITGFIIFGYNVEGTAAATSALEAKIMPIYSNIN